MDARIGWTLSAVGLVVMFVGARVYIGRAIDREEQAPDPTQEVEHRKPRPAKPMPERKPDALGGLKDVYGRVMVVLEDDSPEALADAHTALAEVATVQFDWADPTLAKRADEMFAKMEHSVRNSSTADPKLKAHVLQVRVDVAGRAGVPDADAAARLEALRGTDPEAFRWD